MEKLDRFLLLPCCSISQQTKTIFLQVLNHFLKSEEEISEFLKTANLEETEKDKVKEEIQQVITSIKGLGTFTK